MEFKWVPWIALAWPENGFVEKMRECPEYSSGVFFQAKCVQFSSRWLCRKHLATLYTWVCAEHSASTCGNIICTSRILSQLKVNRASLANSCSDAQIVVTMTMVESFTSNREPSAQDQNPREGTHPQKPNWNRKSQCCRKGTENFTSDPETLEKRTVRLDNRIDLITKLFSEVFYYFINSYTMIHFRIYFSTVSIISLASSLQ